MSMPRTIPNLLFTLCALCASSAMPSHAQQERNDKMIFRVSIRVDLGRDLGQNFGALFEASDDHGRPVAGAGFVGAFNTEARSDRRALHFFVKFPEKADTYTVEHLPRACDDAGVYLHAFEGRLFAHSRGGVDQRLLVWDPEGGRWVMYETTTPLSVSVGDGALAATSDRITYRGRTILSLAEDQGRIGATYYANGFFIFHRRFLDRTPRVDHLVACPWTPDDDAIDLAKGHVQEMDASHPIVVYAYGQLGPDILAATNTGGVYRFDGSRWTTLYERPDSNVSFQVYAMINHDDRLLLGQYPTGELYEFDGKELILRKGWPPVMPGVARNAREAQTAAIYGGDLYAGVWPWAEVWRYDGAAWTFVRRMFTHPDLTDAVTHPYEAECKKLGIVLNLWGQRVTSLIPSGDALYIATSAKGPSSFDPQYDFLSDGRGEEYGAIYRLARPGHLSVHTEWKPGPTQFDLTLTEDGMSVSQDGRLLGSAPLDPALTAGVALKDIAWGKGVFGAFRGKMLEKTVQRENP